MDVDSRIIDTKDAKLFAKNHNLTFYETSAKTGKNIQNIFDKLIEQLMNIYPFQRISGSINLETIRKFYISFLKSKKEKIILENLYNKYINY